MRIMLWLVIWLCLLNLCCLSIFYCVLLASFIAYLLCYAYWRALLLPCWEFYHFLVVCLWWVSLSPYCELCCLFVVSFIISLICVLGGFCHLWIFFITKLFNTSFSSIFLTPFQWSLSLPCCALLMFFFQFCLVLFNISIPSFNFFGVEIEKNIFSTSFSTTNPTLSIFLSFSFFSLNFSLFFSFFFSMCMLCYCFSTCVGEGKETNF